MATTFRQFLNEQLENPEFRKEWLELEPDYAVVESLIAARRAAGLTQIQLSEKAGVDQIDIRNIETGNGNPTLDTLKKLANAMGMSLRLELVSEGGK